MTGKMTFQWNALAFRIRARDAAERALTRVAVDAYEWWAFIVPIGKSTKTHEAGTLRDSWGSGVLVSLDEVKLYIWADAPYAIYIELGTGVMPPRAPLRNTAGEVIPFVLPYFIEEIHAG